MLDGHWPRPKQFFVKPASGFHNVNKGLQDLANCEHMDHFSRSWCSRLHSHCTYILFWKLRSFSDQKPGQSKTPTGLRQRYRSWWGPPGRSLVPATTATVNSTGGRMHKGLSLITANECWVCSELFVISMPAKLVWPRTVGTRPDKQET